MIILDLVGSYGVVLKSIFSGLLMSFDVSLRERIIWVNAQTSKYISLKCIFDVGDTFLFSITTVGAMTTAGAFKFKAPSFFTKNVDFELSAYIVDFLYSEQK